MKKRLGILLLLSLGLFATSLQAQHIVDVVGGSDAEAGEFPFNVIIKDKGEGSIDDEFVCTGSLIASEWVLTAAHCIKGGGFLFFKSPESMEVIVGTHTSVELASSARTYQVLELIPHPDFNNFEHDIGLIKIEPVEWVPGFVEPVNVSANLGFPNLITHVAPYRAWINSQINPDPPFTGGVQTYFPLVAK